MVDLSIEMGMSPELSLAVALESDKSGMNWVV